MSIRILLLTLFLGITALASPGTGMVVKSSGSEVTLNRGSQDGLAPGTRYLVFRNGQSVGEVEVTLVDQYQSAARLVSGSAQAGDALRAASVASVGGPPPETSVSEPVPTVYSAEQLEQYEERYRDKFRGRTAQRTFTAVSQTPRTDSGMDAMMWMNIATLAITSFGPYGFTGSPQIIASTVADSVATNVWMGDYYQDAEVEITLTNWDEPLMDSFSDYTAYREARGNLQQMAAVKSILYSQKGLDQNQVVEVKLRNTGPVIAQLAPFNFHIFLLVDGQRVQCQRYDQILDKALNPGEEVLGFVYFPRLESPGTTRIALEDILGNSEEIGFGR